MLSSSKSKHPAMTQNEKYIIFNCQFVTAPLCDESTYTANCFDYLLPDWVSKQSEGKSGAALFYDNMFKDSWLVLKLC